MFWDMTLAELERAMNSRRRMDKIRLQEKASFDYRLADLIGYSIARTQHSSNKMPTLTEAYPSLFEEESEELRAKKQEQQEQLSVLRFKLFANAHNQKLQKEAANNQ